MVVYPQQLTSEERALRKRFSKLQEKLKELKHSQSSSKLTSPQGSSSGQTLSKKAAVKKVGPTDKKDKSSPKDALAMAKKLVEAGKLNITKSPNKTTGFKRVGESISKPSVVTPAPKRSSSSSFPPSYTPSGVNKTPLNKPKVAVPKREESRQLYSRFIKASENVTHHKIPKRTEDMQSEIHSSSSDTGDTHESSSHSKKECTVYVAWRDTQLQDEVLQIAFSRFGSVVDVRVKSQNEAFVTFESPSIATTVQREMNKGMIHGTEIKVDFANDENGFIELPPEAASQPWARIAAGMEVTQDLSNRKRTFTSRQKMSYEQDF